MVCPSCRYGFLRPCQNENGRSVNTCDQCGCVYGSEDPFDNWTCPTCKNAILTRDSDGYQFTCGACGSVYKAQFCKVVHNTTAYVSKDYSKHSPAILQKINAGAEQPETKK